MLLGGAYSSASEADSYPSSGAAYVVPKFGEGGSRLGQGVSDLVEHGVGANAPSSGGG